MEIFVKDYLRATHESKISLTHVVRDFIFQHRIRYTFYLRMSQKTNSLILKFFYEAKLYRLSRKFGLEIKSQAEIGPGFVLIHPYNITVSPFAKIGENVTMCKGSTIGIAEGCKNPGAPTIGNRVYIGINSTVLGGITIGTDVLIAPNTMVNLDVPDHSVVIGNPCIINHKENATAPYVW